VRFELTTSALRGGALSTGAATRCRSGPSAVRGRSRSRTRRLKLPTVDSNHDYRTQNAVACQLAEWALSVCCEGDTDCTRPAATTRASDTMTVGAYNITLFYLREQALPGPFP
jgi:hypothetical protein